MSKLMRINICILLLIFLSAAMNTRPEQDIDRVESLITERIGILNHFYGGKMAYEDARGNIEKIETGELLKEDLALMKAFDMASVDQIADYTIEMMDCQRSSYGILKGELSIFWVMSGESGLWRTAENYYFTAEDHDKTMKLTQLKKI